MVQHMVCHRVHSTVSLMLAQGMVHQTVRTVSRMSSRSCRTYGKDEELYSTSTIPTVPETETPFRTTTPSAPAMTAKQVDPVHVHTNTSWSGPAAHCAHVHKLPKQVCKPGNSLALRKVQHPHNRRTSVTRLPLMKQDILSHYSGCFEGIGHFPGKPYKFHLKPEHKPARHAPRKFQPTLKLHSRKRSSL